MANSTARNAATPAVPPDQMTPEQYQELAARYHGGPDWRSDHAQECGRDFTAHLGEAREALR